jgi:transcriptional regulator with XRE-family HTH domain
MGGVHMPGKITDARIAAGLSRAELSRASGVSLRTLEDWESGRNKPRDVYVLARLAKFLHCKIEDLIEIPSE